VMQLMRIGCMLIWLLYRSINQEASGAPKWCHAACISCKRGQGTAVAAHPLEESEMLSLVCKMLSLLWQLPARGRPDVDEGCAHV
jgi:hypothetical protein